MSNRQLYTSNLPMRLQITYPHEMRDEVREMKEYGFWIEAIADIQEQKIQTEQTEQTDKPEKKED